MEEIQKYTIDIDLADKIMGKITKVEKRMLKFQNNVNKAIQANILAQSRFNRLMEAGGTFKGKVMGAGANYVPKPSSPRQPRSPTNDPTSELEKRQRIIESFKQSTRLIRQMDKAERDKLVTVIQEQKTLEGMRNAARQIKNQVADEHAKRRENLRLMEKQNFVQQRMTASVRQMVGGLASIYAGQEFLRGVTRVGQEFESAESTMLAVSENSEAAANNLKFAQGEAVRLGASLVDTTKDFARLLASGKGKVTVDANKEALTGLLEASTVLGLSADDTAGALRALQQMEAKGQVMA